MRQTREDVAALPDEQVRIWIDACNDERAREALRELLAYRVRGFAAPLAQGAMKSVLTKLIDWADRRCPCENDLPNPCPLCMADVNNPRDACIMRASCLPQGNHRSG